MSAYKLTIAYDGGPFAGWAAQPGLKTIQRELEAVLEQVLQRPVRLTVAGRTDAGVHAWGQVASFEVDGDPPDALAQRINSMLPQEIAVLDAQAAPDGFDARRQATAFLRSKDVVHKLFEEIGPRYAERPGGYTRIVKLGPRRSDATEMVFLELV